MNHATTTSVTLIGITAHLTQVRAEPEAGRPGGLIVLGPDGRSMHETRDRVYAAILNAGLPLPGHRVTVSFPPSEQPPPSSSIDLAVAALILASGDLFAPTVLDGAVILGELGLDGSVRPVRGVLPMAVAAAEADVTRVVVPVANAHEADLVTSVRVIAVDSLRQFVDWASTGTPPPPSQPGAGQSLGMRDAYIGDLADLPAAMSGAAWALEVAAAGGHHVGVVGPAGSAKTMLAQRLPSILPDLDDDAALEVTALRSAAGLLAPGAGLVRRPPLQAPYHTASLPALLGGGPRASRPGAVSLAHHGVLLLDAAPEFGHRALAALTHPLDTGRVVLAGAGRTVTYPARMQLVLGANACPCFTPVGREPCTVCGPQGRVRYLRRMSALWQRTDIRLRLSPPQGHDDAAGEPSAVVAHRVAYARQIAADRWAALGYRTNAEAPTDVLRSGVCRLPTSDINPLLRLLGLGAVSEDGYDRILRIAWSISDLRDADRPDRDDIAKAIDLHLDQRP